MCKFISRSGYGTTLKLWTSSIVLFLINARVISILFVTYMTIIDMIKIRFIVPDSSVIVFSPLYDVDKGTGVPWGLCHPQGNNVFSLCTL